ncbi:hypothetical protein PSQ19_11650 [Devosia algicola]|uniref:Uncharacterized protein n=1 Tax=Devosia algicola TaxID=3026418 RepID=A0ABY7YJN6_9HYPH|nr:hypothetical protein [Devosia algicola]WDR01458.1 hypothetical protein PSQ19_11650 [Devosia algicola]
MAMLGMTTRLDQTQPRPVNWFGRSGRAYGLISESLDQFRLAERELYLIAKGSLVLWVGSMTELVVDPMSRTRFKLALDCADRAFRLATPGDDVERMTTIWDLEGAEPEARRSAA